MKIVSGRGKYRTVVELPHGSVFKRDEKSKDCRIAIQNITDMVLRPSV